MLQRIRQLFAAIVTKLRALITRKCQSMPTPTPDKASVNPAENTNYFLAPVIVKGHFVIDGNRIAFTGTAIGHEDGRFVIEVNDQPWTTDNYVAMHRMLGVPGIKSNYFGLTASSDDGKRFSSDTVWFSYLSNHGAAIKFAQLTIELQSPTPSQVPVLAMRLRGLRNFGPMIAKTPLGTLELAAPHNTAADDPAGVIRISAPSSQPSNSWRDDAERCLIFVRSCMALAHGGRLQMPLLEYYEGTSCTATYYVGRGIQPELQVQHPLANCDYFQAVAKRYFADSPWPDVLWDVQGWMHLETSHDEVRVLSAVIALETLLRLLPDIETTHIIKADFKPIKEHLHKALAEIEGLSSNLHDKYANSISSMNQRPLRDKVEAVLDHYQVRKDDIISPLKTAINERNKIVHEGQAQKPGDSWSLTVLTREAVTRVLLKEMDYEGIYECYIGGRHTRNFPACEPVG